MIIIKNFIIIVIWFFVGFILGGSAGIKVGRKEEAERTLEIMEQYRKTCEGEKKQ